MVSWATGRGWPCHGVDELETSLLCSPQIARLRITDLWHQRGASSPTKIVRRAALGLQGKSDERPRAIRTARGWFCLSYTAAAALMRLAPNVSSSPGVPTSTAVLFKRASTCSSVKVGFSVLIRAATPATHEAKTKGASCARTENMGTPGSSCGQWSRFSRRRMLPRIGERKGRREERPGGRRPQAWASSSSS